MIDDLKKSIQNEILMVRELSGFMEKAENAGDNQERRIYQELIKSLSKRIKLVNDGIPAVLATISLLKKLPETNEKNEDLQKKQREAEIFASKKSREEFFNELNISNALIKRIKKKKDKGKGEVQKYKTYNFYGKLANRLFLDFSNKVIKSGKMKSLTLDIKRSNINVLGATYLSMMFLTTCISFAAGIFLMTFLLFFSVGFEYPFINAFQGGYLIRFAEVMWVPFAVSALVFLGFYFYPGAEKSSKGKKIDQELPFVVIHMGSIAGSGIKPMEILKIIGTSNEYKYAGQEIRKLLNQTNIYGYDLSTALRNISLLTPSAKLSELFTGMSVTINSGGDMKKFFEKRAESLLLNYRLEREKATKSAETFMDLYISIVIATPMILLMILVMISVSGLQSGFGSGQMSIALIGIVVIINILFLTFLHLKQPTY